MSDVQESGTSPPPQPDAAVTASVASIGAVERGATRRAEPISTRGRLLLLAMLASICCCVGLRVYSFVEEHDMASGLARAGMEPPPATLDAYIEQSVFVGMKREMVETILGRVVRVKVVERGAPACWTGAECRACDRLLLVYGRLPGQDEEFYMCYDMEGGIVSATVGGLDARQIDIRRLPLR